MVERVVCVDPHCTGPEGIRDVDGGVEVGSVDSGGQTIGGVVGHADGISLVFEFGNGADGTEDLFLLNLHVFADVGEDGRFDEVAFLSNALAADFDLGSLLLSSIYVSG